MSENYIPNAGQTFLPALHSPYTQTVPYDKAADLPSKEGGYQFHEKWKNSGYLMVGTDEVKFLKGVTPQMLDWFFANMEKAYYLWAPGEHLSFQWKVSPAEIGYEGSVEYIYETNHFLPVYMKRISMDNYPFTECASHCWISDGTFGDSGRGMRLIHMYDEIEGGTKWITIKLVHKSDADWIREYRSKADPAKTLAHNEYEAGRFKDFLPEIYRLWKDIPNPSQNVSFDLRTKQNPDGTWSHICDNKPPVSTSEP